MTLTGLLSSQPQFLNALNHLRAIFPDTNSHCKKKSQMCILRVKAAEDRANGVWFARPQGATHGTGCWQEYGNDPCVVVRPYLHATHLLFLRPFLRIPALTPLVNPFTSQALAPLFGATDPRLFVGLWGSVEFLAGLQWQTAGPVFLGLAGRMEGKTNILRWARCAQGWGYGGCALRDWRGFVGGF